MHDSMQCNPTQGQGHKPLEVGNPSIFTSYLLRHLQWELATERERVLFSTIQQNIKRITQKLQRLHGGLPERLISPSELATHCRPHQLQFITKRCKSAQC